MRWLVVLLALAAATLPAAPVRAAYDTGADLRQWCADPDGSGFGAVYCLGYVTAVADVIEHNPVNGLRACVPDAAVVGDLVQRVTAYLDRHPDRLNYGAAGLVADALGAAYPCPGPAAN